VSSSKQIVTYRRAVVRIGTAVMVFLSILLNVGFVNAPKVVKVYIIGDSTVTDYSLENDYATKRYPQMGWGQVFQQFLVSDSLAKVSGIIAGDSVIVDDRAKGGRSTRSFFQEGRWRSVYESLKKDDVVIMQFGHNDESVEKVLRYVNIEGYQEFLRLFVSQTLQKGAIPIVLSPVNRNYPWMEGKLVNCHGEYPQAAQAVAAEFSVPFIDLTQLSIKRFTAAGQDYSTNHFFMNLPASKYEAYPEGISDNTHFQPEGATEVARLVFEAMQKLHYK